MSDDQKLCLHCQKVLPEKIDAFDLLGGHYGECAGCRSWKRNHYAQRQNAIVQESAKHPAYTQNPPHEHDHHTLSRLP